MYTPTASRRLLGVGFFLNLCSGSVFHSSPPLRTAGFLVFVYPFNHRMVSFTSVQVFDTYTRVVLPLLDDSEFGLAVKYLIFRGIADITEGAGPDIARHVNREQYVLHKCAAAAFSWFGFLALTTCFFLLSPLPVRVLGCAPPCDVHLGGIRHKRGG